MKKSLIEKNPLPIFLCCGIIQEIILSKNNEEEK
jgi:hypothetical protein